MARERKIEPVKSNADKGKTYTEHMEKYKKAVENECYFEALLITYAMMEDRLRSYLYYLGCLKSRASYEFDNDAISDDIKFIVDTYSNGENSDLGITNISGKLCIVKSVNKWSLDGCPNHDKSGYLGELAACMDTRSDPQDIITTIDELKNWCRYRNEIIHALLNKNLDSLYEDLPKRVEGGMALARIIDKYVSRLKGKNNNPREFLNLEEN